MDFRLVIPVHEPRIGRPARAVRQATAPGSGTFADRPFGSYPGDRTFHVVTADGSRSLEMRSIDMSRFSKQELDAMFQRDSDSDSD